VLWPERPAECDASLTFEKQPASQPTYYITTFLPTTSHLQHYPLAPPTPLPSNTHPQHQLLRAARHLDLAAHLPHLHTHNSNPITSTSMSSEGEQSVKLVSSDGVEIVTGMRFHSYPLLRRAFN
jgi:hypothetical protein